MNAVELAATLNGREYPNEITEEECQQAKDANLLVVFGASDDSAALRGFAYDEVGCCNGGSFCVDAKGLFPSWPEGDEKDYDDAKEYFERVNMPGIEITAIWCSEHNDATWSYTASVPVARFDIMEDGERYCEGIVVDCSRLAGQTGD